LEKNVNENIAHNLDGIRRVDNETIILLIAGFFFRVKDENIEIKYISEKFDLKVKFEKIGISSNDSIVEIIGNKQDIHRLLEHVEYAII